MHRGVENVDIATVLASTSAVEAAEYEDFSRADRSDKTAYADRKDLIADFDQGPLGR